MISKRTWVDSESFPLFARDGYRVLHHGTIFEKKGRFFGKWIPKHSKSEFNEVAVLDEGVIR